jgi:hypothetical protein
MSKIEIVKRGRKIKVDERLAKFLIARSGYQRRDMVAQSAPTPVATQVLEAPREKRAYNKKVIKAEPGRDES